MPISVHRASVPVFEQMLDSLTAVLRKAEAHCAAENIPSSELLTLRLAPDMFTLTQQVQRACIHAVGAGARLADVAIPQEDDEENSFEELYARIDRARDFLSGLTEEQLSGSEGRPIEQPTRVGTLKFPTGPDFLLRFAMPQFYFHVTTAYDIVRHAGVQIGKVDFMGSAVRQ